MDIKPTQWGPVAKVAGLTAAVAAFVAVAATLIVAYWPESSAQAKQNFCTSLTNLSSTVMSYQGLDPATATNDQLESAADDIAGAWNDVVDDANDWANAYDNPLTNAYDDLYWAIQALPSSNTIGQDIDALQPELSAFPQAYHDTFDGSGCSNV